MHCYQREKNDNVFNGILKTTVSWLENVLRRYIYYYIDYKSTSLPIPLAVMFAVYPKSHKDTRIQAKLFRFVLMRCR